MIQLRRETIEWKHTPRDAQTVRTNPAVWKVVFCTRNMSHWEFKDEIASFKQLYFLTLNSYTPRGFVISSVGSCKIKKGRRDSTAPLAAAWRRWLQLLSSQFSQTRAEFESGSKWDKLFSWKSKITGKNQKISVKHHKKIEYESCSKVWDNCERRCSYSFQTTRNKGFRAVFQYNFGI